jgi:transposase
MAQPLLPDDLWAVIEPLLPPPPRPGPKGGRPPVENRPALTGILFALKSGLPWEMLPREMGCGSGMTCWRRLRDWQAAGAWARAHAELLARMRGADLIDWSRASVDSGSVRAKRGAAAPGRTRWTAARRASSGTSWSTGRARRSA